MQVRNHFFEALENWKAFKFAAQGIEVLLWGLLFTVIALVIWRYRQWLRLFVGRIGLPQQPLPQLPQPTSPPLKPKPRRRNNL